MCGIPGEPDKKLYTPVCFTKDGIPVCHKCLESHFATEGHGYATQTNCKKCGEPYDEFQELNFRGKPVGIISLRDYS